MRVVLVIVAASACEPNSHDTAGRPASSSVVIETSARKPPSAPPGAGSQNLSAPIPTVQASGAPSPTALLAGTWRGSFESKKAKVTLDPGVSEPSFKKDKGTVATGPGKIEIVVAPDGTVRGHTEGSLGRAIVSGSSDDPTLSASFLPADEDGPRMAGTIVLTHSSGRLTGTLSASSADATLARAATLDLARD